MKKIFSLGLLVVAVVLGSCSKKNETQVNKVSDSDVNKLIEAKYGLKPLSISDFDFSKLNLNSSDLDISRAKHYGNESGANIIVIPSLSDTQKAIAVRYWEEKEDHSYVIEKQLIARSTTDQNGDNYITVEDDLRDINFTYAVKQGEANYKAKGKGGTVFEKMCQREANETFSECFKRESDEFCSDLASTIAYYTHAAIPAMIAALCSC